MVAIADWMNRQQQDAIRYLRRIHGQSGRQDETPLHATIDGLGKGQMSLHDTHKEKITLGWKREEIMRAWRTLKARKLVFQADVSSEAQADDLLGELDGLG